MAFKDSQLEDHFNYISDTFKSMDGGHRRYKLRQMLEELEQRLEEIEIMIRHWHSRKTA